MKTRLTRSVLAALLLTVVTAVAGYGANPASQTVSIAAAANVDITVPLTASIASTAPGSCGTTSTTVNVKSNRVWNLQIESDPVANPAGKPKDALGNLMVNAFQYDGGDVLLFTNITSSYVNLFNTNQARTTGTGTNVTVNYQQCVDWADAPGTYTIVVNYFIP